MEAVADWKASVAVDPKDPDEKFLIDVGDGVGVLHPLRLADVSPVAALIPGLPCSCSSGEVELAGVK